MKIIHHKPLLPLSLVLFLVASAYVGVPIIKMHKNNDDRYSLVIGEVYPCSEQFSISMEDDRYIFNRNSSSMATLAVDGSMLLPTVNARTTDMDQIAPFQKVAKMPVVPFKEKEGKTRYGVLAEDIEKQFPEDVISIELDGEKRTAFDPGNLLMATIATVQEMQATIALQQQEINTLQERLASHYPKTALPIQLQAARLSANQPNPFREQTTIDCFIPASIHIAQLVIYDLTGKNIYTEVINERGQTSLLIDHPLEKGYYIYNLILDDQPLLEGKKMVKQ